MHPSRSPLATTTARILGLVVAAVALTAAPARSADLDEFREVSYLVFQKSRGFSSPKYKADLLDGSLSIRFEKMPENWRSILTPQIATRRKQRFFKGMEPIVENGKTVGIRVFIGIGLFGFDSYVKKKPTRWVVRVGENRMPPFGPGAYQMPTVPYAEVMDIDAPDREEFGRAERQLANGDARGCTTFTEFRRGEHELGGWATLREADCLARAGEFEPAIRRLRNLADTTDNRALKSLATVRVIEMTGDILTPRFNRKAYEFDGRLHEFMGTVGDELAFREVRALMMRRDIPEALLRLDALTKARPESPFIHGTDLLSTLRWRALRDSALGEHWLEVSRLYLALPRVSKTDPHWLDIHRLGAKALRAVGAANRAVPIYLKLLKSRQPGVSEGDTLVHLAACYVESNDAHRARVTLEFVTEQYPDLAKTHPVRRLRARLAKLKGKTREHVAEARALAADGPLLPEDEAVVVDAATAVLETEGVNAARQLLENTRGGLAQEVARDLAMAAGDCDAIVTRTEPVELAAGDDLLWGAACLLGRGRLEEASVLLEAAQIWTTAAVVDPDNAELILTIEEHAKWWLQQRGRLESPPTGPRS